MAFCDGGYTTNLPLADVLDGQTATPPQRSYSIASPPGAERLELTVVRFDDGEVSPYLTTVLDAGDQIELRGPIGGYFVWDADDTRPVLLAGGGSGSSR